MNQLLNADKAEGSKILKFCRCPINMVPFCNLHCGQHGSRILLPILELEHTHVLDGDTVPIIILLFTQDGSTESEVFGNSMVFGLN